MAQTKILLDSNSYFRLATHINPLLFQEFGIAKYCLYVLAELDQEYSRNSRLQNKFHWVNGTEYCQNRQKRISLSRQQKKGIQIAKSFLWKYVQTTLPGPSMNDVIALCYGQILGIDIVTDDFDMIALANVFDIKVLKTLELLKLMVDNNHITITKVRAIASYWSFDNDLPKDYITDYQNLFGETPP